MQKSWDQVSWVLWWRHTTASTTSSKLIIYSSKPGSRATVLGVADIVVIGNGQGEGRVGIPSVATLWT
jgi:hypothetical protein